MRITFSPPDISEEDIEAVAETLRSGWITTGPKTKEFEKEIAKKVGTDMCVCLNSQTACAELVLRLLGIGEGDEVITSAYTYTASASVVCHVGAKLVLVDTQKDGIEMDYDALEKAITPNTKAVIPVDLAGIPCDYNRIFEIVNRKKDIFTPSSALQKALGRIAVCADTAHALGAEYHGEPIGSIADFSSFSFHAVKNLTTAEGGALTWRKIAGIPNEKIYHKLQLFSLHGQSREAYEKDQIGSWEYDIVGTWYKCNMTDIAAALGLSQLKNYDKKLVRRKEIIEKYDAAFHKLGIMTLEHFKSDVKSSGHLYITRVPGITVKQRNDIIIDMANKGIVCNVHYKPLPMHTAYRALGFDIKNFPNAHAFFKNEITLPLHTCLTDEMVDYIIKSYSETVKNYI